MISPEIVQNIDYQKVSRADWDILTAMRGPDFIEDNGAWKICTTAIIRGKVGVSASKQGVNVVEGFDEVYVTPARLWGKHCHFVGHITKAAMLLELKIVEVEDITKASHYVQAVTYLKFAIKHAIRNCGSPLYVDDIENQVRKVLSSAENIGLLRRDDD